MVEIRYRKKATTDKWWKLHQKSWIFPHTTFFIFSLAAERKINKLENLLFAVFFPFSFHIHIQRGFTLGSLNYPIKYLIDKKKNSNHSTTLLERFTHVNDWSKTDEKFSCNFLTLLPSKTVFVERKVGRERCSGKSVGESENLEHERAFASVITGEGETCGVWRFNISIFNCT